MKKLFSLFLSLALMVGVFAGCSSTTGNEPSNNPTDSALPEGVPSESGTSNYPVTIENNGNTITYEKAPERVVVLSYTTAEIMTALGLESKVVALAPCMNEIDEVIPEYRDAISEMPLFPEGGMNNGVPNLETVLSVEPDFVYGSFYSFFATNCGEAADYLANDISIYASENTYTEGATLNELYTEILNIGKIFDVNERAAELVNELKYRESAVAEAVMGLEPASIFIFDYDNGDGTYGSTGGTNFLDSLITSAGGKDVFGDLNQSYSVVSPEEIISRNPDYVLTISYYTQDDGQNKIDLMKSSADFTELSAVQQDNFLSLGGLAVGASAGLQSLDALEAIAEFLHPEAFAN